MNSKEEIKNENIKLEISIPLLTQEEINRIDIYMDGIINKFTKMIVKEKNLAIAQYIIDKQQKELEQKESILNKVIDKLKKIEKRKQMKIIDVLNKKANGSLEDKFMFVFRNKVYIYDKKEDLIINKSSNSRSWLGIEHPLDNALNDKVLLIEKEGTNENT